MNRWIRILLVTIGAVLGVVVIAVAAGIAYLHTDSGRSLLISQLEGAVSDEKTTLVVEGVSGSLFDRLRVESITLADPEGPWLVVEQAELAWKPMRLAGANLHIDLLSAKRVRVDRVPPATAEEGTDEPAGFPTSLPISLTVEKLDIARAELGAPLLGEEAAFSLQGTASAGEAARLATRLEVDRLDGPEASARAEVTYDAPEETLDVDVTVADSADGILANLLGRSLAGPPSLTLAAEGPLKALHGTLEARAEGLAEITSEFTLDLAEPLSARLKGETTFDPLLGADLRPVLHGPVTYDTSFSLDPETMKLAVDHATLGNEVIGLEIKGDADLTKTTMDLSLAYTLKKPEVVSRLTAPLEIEGSHGSIAVLAKEDHEPTVGGTIRFDGLVAPGADLGDTELDLALTLPPRFDFAKAGLRFDVTARPTLRALDPAALKDALGAEPEIKVQGTYDMAGSSLDLDTFDLNGEVLDAQASGEISLDRMSLSADANLTVSDLKVLRQLAGMPLEGVLETQVSVTSEGIDKGVSGEIEAKVREFAFGQPKVESALGETLDLAANFQWRAGQEVEVSQAVLTAKELRVNLDGTMSEDASSVDARYRVEIDRLAALAEIAGIELSGKAKLEGTAKGALPSPRVTGQLETEELTVNAMSFPRARADIALDSLELPGGTVNLSAATPYGEIVAETRFSMRDDGSVLLDPLSLQRGKTRLAGKLVLPSSGVPLSGNLDLEVPDLGSLSGLAGTELAGRLSSKVTLEAPEQTQRARVTLEGSNVSVAGTRIGSLTANGVLRDLLGTPRARLDAKAGQVASGENVIEVVTVSAEGTLQSFAASLEARGTAGVPFELSSETRIEMKTDATNVTVSSLSGTVAGEPLKLQEPLNVTAGTDVMSMKGLSLSFSGGRVNGNAELSARRVQADIEIARLPLELARLASPDLDIAGSLDGSLRLSGSPSAPEGSFSLRASDVSLGERLGEEMSSLSVEVDGRLAKGALDVDGTVGGIPGTTVALQGRVPVALSVSPVEVSVPSDGSLRASAKIDGDTTRITQLFLPDVHRVSGTAKVDVRVSGTVAQPIVEGSLNLENGRYENLETGTLLTNVVIDVGADERRITLRELSASDGQNGQLTGKGTVVADPSQAFPVDLSLEFQHMMLARLDDLSAEASGNISITGSMIDTLVKGRIETDRVEARIPDDLPPDVVDLNVEEVNVPASEAAANAQKEEQSSAPSTIELDLAVNMPRRVFVRGQGLESEWQGNLSITGTAAQPIIRGNLQPVRGVFTVVGKEFKLRQSTISFDGLPEPDPALDVSAAHDTGDMTAIVKVTGRASDPKIEFTSNPPYPQDEVLSRVLFNKSSGKLSAGEALALAEAARSLAGGGSSSGGVLDKLRNSLGLDELRVTTDDAGDPAVSARKYLSDNVSVGMEQGTGSQSGTASVEIEVTPNITVETDVGQDSAGKVGVKWKWDY